MSTLQKDLEFLSNYTDLKLDQLNTNDQIYKTLQNVLEYKKDLTKYDLYHPISLSYGTVGSAIYGCIYNFYGDIEKKCSPLCNHNSECQYQMWYQNYYDKDMRFIKLNNSDSPNAYLFIKHKLEYLHDDEVNVLSSHGVKHIQLISTNYSKHYYESKLINLTDLSLSQTNYLYSMRGVQVREDVTSSSPRVKVVDKSSIDTTYLIGGIIIGIIIIVVIYWIVNKK